jgi:glycosyltransferase involved in cell wall biosynthesis
VLVGGDWQQERARALRLADSLGIAANLRFLGWVEDEWVAPLYRHAALHVLASRAETFGRSVLEAMACGTLCAVNDIPILREVTAGHAIFTDFADTEASTAALRLGLSDTDSNRDVRVQALRRAREFSMRKLARERVAAMVERFG